MIRPLECFIGLRYLRANRGRGPVSFMTLASLAGITLGVAALIVILSAMNGLEAENRNRLLSLAEHITVKPAKVVSDTSRRATDWAALRRRIEGVEGVAAVEPFVQLEAVLSSGTSLRPVVVRGIDPADEGGDSEVAAIVGPDLLAALTPGSNEILLGRFVLDALRVAPGDRISLWLADPAGGRVGFRPTGFTVAGEFSAGVEEHDANLALTNLADAGRLIGLKGEPEALGIRLDNPLDVARMQARLVAAVGPGYVWSNWATENKSLFQAMRIEKTMMTVVLMFIVGVAAFNIVTSLMMVVNEKEKDIAILRTIGLEPAKVTRIFLVQGGVIGIGGTLVGVAIGLALAYNLETILPWLEQTFHFRIMPPDVFYVGEVPSEVRFSDVYLIAGFALVIAVFATIFPSRKAARIEPAEVLRYE